MQENFKIKKIAVLGAGVMGAQIAAHCVNAGFQTLLFDLAAKEGNKNAIVDKAIANLLKLKPSPLGSNQNAALLKPCNYENNLSELETCDLIIEAIAERLDWKESLYKKIAPVIKKDAILATNTSGLSINTLASFLPDGLRAQFCGVHFFNPPRYMHLAELIPSQKTSHTLFDNLETWLTTSMGKGVVRAKDTPNFIANRVGVFALLAVMYHAEQFKLGLDEVDALTGALIGRPKSATFRTMDVVGLDTMKHVVDTMHEHLQQDPWHSIFQLPKWLLVLIEKGYLGQKTGQGIYRKNGKNIEVYDIAEDAYRPSEGVVSDEIKRIMKEKDAHLRLKQLISSSHPQAKFLLACFRDLYHYCAYHLKDIAHSVRDIDLAMRWGFGWQHGPFELWQASGIKDVIQLINEDVKSGISLASVDLPKWTNDLNYFYNVDGAYSGNGSYVSVSQLPVYTRQYFPEQQIGHPKKNHKTLFENDGVTVWCDKEDVAIVSFKTKANTIGQSLIDGLNEAISISERRCKGLIIYQSDVNNFSSGADLKSIAELVKNNKMNAIEAMITEFQQLMLRIKYSSIPIVSALRGRALGGGCELLLHCAGIVAAFESYPGLVEIGVGLLPAGGGCKEMALRAAMRSQNNDLFATIQKYFEQIATAQVAGSAPDAFLKDYFKETDQCMMHTEEVLSVALAKIDWMTMSNYKAPIARQFPVVGREGHARLQVGLVNWLEGGFISKHDYFLANKIAYVLCGGDVSEGTLVNEAWILNLEKEAFMTFMSTKLTQERIAHLLETGKPLRN